ncbi:MAG: LacI family transcriptional regulator [Candidatus Marinimicrobia bacterium]|nr:LacI family transcriptional regulator [Candidatus Neomarinimicrobiota bacterium]MCF7923051.1 LacI family transcriptional regulator [Candidatus Neomarinimicrobiota bacterium]
MKPTIKIIAKQAGVSTATVSLVMNERPGVSAETRELVKTTITELNYHPKRSASQLARKQTGNIGFIIWEDHFSEIEMFYSQCFLGIELASRDSDYYILLTTVKLDFNTSTDLPRFLKYGDVDGVVLAGRVPHNLVNMLEKRKIPFVLLDYDIPGKLHNKVLIDNYSGGYTAVQKLAEKGRKNIAYIGGSADHPSIKERYRAYTTAIKDLKLNVDDTNLDLVYQTEPEITREIGTEGINALLAKNIPMDAVFCANDTLAIGVIQELKRQKYEVPQDIAVMGFDDIYAARFHTPPLTTIHVPKMDLGKEAYKLLVETINNPEQRPQTRVIGVDCICRETT